MNKIYSLLIILIVLLSINGCVQPNRKPIEVKIAKCAPTTEEAFDLFKKYIQEKDFTRAGQMCDGPNPYMNTLFVPLKNPSIELIPKQKDGAYGIFDKGSYSVYYVNVKDGDVIKCKKCMVILNSSECCRIANIADVVEGKK